VVVVVVEVAAAAAAAPMMSASALETAARPPLPWPPVPVRLREGLADEPVEPLPEDLERVELTLGMSFGSEEGARRAINDFKVRPTDVIIDTFGKTGTTLLQWICHQLRTGGHVDFDDLYQVSPWIIMAYDMGLDPNVAGAEYTPRVFKSHLRLSMVYPGCKYIVSVRKPSTTIISGYNFLLNKGVPGFADMTVSEYALQGTSINGAGTPDRAGMFTTYKEFWQARDCSSVLVLVYEDLVKDMATQIRLIADFIGVVPSPELIERVTAMSTKDFMSKYESQLDESWVHERAKKLDRSPHPEMWTAAPRVVVNKHKDGLSDEAQKFLEDQWREKFAPDTGFETYEEFSRFFSERNAKKSARIAATYSASSAN